MSHLLKHEIGYNKKVLRSRILTKDDYLITNDPYKHFNINNNVICFFNGIDWNIINLSDMLRYPVLYYDFWSEKFEKTFINSLVVCPITMRSAIYKGHMEIIDVVNDTLVLLNKDTDDEFLMDSPYTGKFDDDGKEKKIKSHIKRHEVKLHILKDAYIYMIDPKYIVLDKSKDDLYIISEKYYTNRLTYEGEALYTTLHPKTIVYIVQYWSYTDKKYKFTVIVGKDINKDTVTGYSYKQSGIWHYLNNYKHKFVEMKAYIYPIFWFMVEKLYRDIKMVIVK